MKVFDDPDNLHFLPSALDDPPDGMLQSECPRKRLIDDVLLFIITLLRTRGKEPSLDKGNLVDVQKMVIRLHLVRLRLYLLAVITYDREPGRRIELDRETRRRGNIGHPCQLTHFISERRYSFDNILMTDPQRDDMIATVPGIAGSDELELIQNNKGTDGKPDGGGKLKHNQRISQKSPVTPG